MIHRNRGPVSHHFRDDGVFVEIPTIIRRVGPYIHFDALVEGEPLKLVPAIMNFKLSAQLR